MSISISAHALEYRHPDGSAFFSDFTFVLERSRYGLIGANGTGKSTLLRLIHGEIAPSSGSLHVRGTTAYLAQQPAHRDGSILSVFGSAERHCVSKALARIGAGHLDLQRHLATLSGGEEIRVRLAAATLDGPDWLLLDEPSNHLDREGRTALYQLVETWQCGLIIASHDRKLLERVDHTMELSNLGLRRYGGPYSFYDIQRRLEDRAGKAAVAASSVMLSQERVDAQEHVERSARRASIGKRRRGSLPKVVLGADKRRAELSAAKGRRVHGARVEAALKRLSDARDELREVPGIALDVPNSRVATGKVVFAHDRLSLGFNGAMLWPEPVSLSVVGPQRVALCGPNGSGKSTLLRYIAAHASVHCAYLDQRLAMLPQKGTLAEAMRAAAPELAEHERRVRLGRLGFTQERTQSRLAQLSGGERMRAAMAMLFAAAEPPKLLLLDEPESHLDLPSLQALVSALAGFHGALVAVSHDRAFLGAIRTEREIHLIGRETGLPNFDT